MKATACEPKAMLSMNTQVLCRSCPMLARSTWGLAPCGLGAVVLVGAVDVISHPSHVRFRQHKRPDKDKRGVCETACDRDACYVRAKPSIQTRE
jgi:hypothetical protein